MVVVSNGKMNMRWLAVSSLGWLLMACTAVVAQRLSKAERYSNRRPIIKWLGTQNGGYVSDKLYFQSDGHVYASRDIEEGEILLVLPHTAPIPIQTNDGGDQDTPCDTAVWMVNQYMSPAADKKGDDDDENPNYGPYLDFLFENVAPKFKHPMAWSKEGKRLMRFVVGGELEPRGFGSASLFAEECEDTEQYDYSSEMRNKRADELLEVAWQLITARNWGDKKLLPVYDMIGHRNGRKHNIDILEVSDSEDTYWAYEMGAIRPIQAGEEIHMSYNECYDENFCAENFSNEYMTPDILYTQGFVEDYPRRFGIETGYEATGYDKFIFEVDQVVNHQEQQDGSNGLVVNWITEEPTALHLNFFHAHLQRLWNMTDHVTERANLLEDPRETKIVLDYFDALVTAFEQVYLQGRGEVAVISEEDEKMSASSLMSCVLHAQGNASIIDQCRADQEIKKYNPNYFDDLQERPDPISYEFDIVNCNHRFEEVEQARDNSSSLYQAIIFDHSYYEDVEKYDTCLNLAGIPQSCTAFRPHYHEIYVHYPASFVGEVKRVLFMGGGDLMILHEIMKYNSTLEFVYGLELDQQVLRQSFRHYGIQPHLDDPRVRWIFGDAAKSLLTIPLEYYGTFDLVFIDLMSYVADTVMVDDGVSLLDVGMRLLKPTGALAQNRDFAQREKPSHTKYAVDMVFDDIPLFCHEFLNMASNGIDFVSQKPYNHKIDTLFFKANHEAYYGAWTNYHHNKDFQPLEDPKKEVTSLTSKSIGLYTAIEVEGSNMSLDDLALVQDKVRQTLLGAGFSHVGLDSYSPSTNHKEFSHSVLKFIMAEGSLVARINPGLEYVAMDLQLWSNFEKQEVAVGKLVDSIGCDFDCIVSTYSISTGGMLGTTHKNEIPLTQKIPYEEELNSTGSPIPNEENFGLILGEMAHVIPSNKPHAVVLCGVPSSPCSSLNATQDALTATVLWSCLNLQQGADAIGEMLECESTSRRALLNATMDVGAFHGMIIDPHATRSMGRVVHKILNSTLLRKELFADSFAVLAPIFNDEPDPWRNTFMERLRTSIVYNPVHHVDAFVGNSSDWRLGLFSAGDPLFYSRIASTRERLVHRLGQRLKLAGGKSGSVSYNPDFAATTPVFNEDYDIEPSKSQWFSQKATAQQDLIQLELQLPLYPLAEGDHVLVNDLAHHFEGVWHAARVVADLKNGSYSVLIQDETKERVMPRPVVRRNDTSMAAFSKGERVLMKFRESRERWRQGYVIENNKDGTYRVRIMTLDTDWVMDAPREDLVSQFEQSAPLESSRVINAAKLNETLQHALKQLNIGAKVSLFENVGLGCILTAAWPRGDIVVTWDGGNHVDLNVFTDLHEREETSSTLTQSLDRKKKIVETIKSIFVSDLSLEVMGWDRMPRGVGKVVNFPLPSNATWFGQFHRKSSSEKLETSSSSSTETNRTMISNQAQPDGISKDSNTCLEVQNNPSFVSQ